MRDALSTGVYRDSVGGAILRAFAPWSRMPPEVWAEEIYRLPGGNRFRWTYAPYAREMFRSIFDRRTVETVFEMYSRGLKSTVVLLALGYIIDQSPRRILSLWPTNSQAEKWSKDNLCGELFDTTPPLHFLGMQTGRRVASNTLLHKLFPGGLIDIFGANAPGDMRRAKGSFLYGEEIDAIASELTDEGDQLAIFNKRGDEYPDTIRVFASYPSLVGSSRIHAKIEQSDWNQWHSTCAVCGGEPFVMSRSQLKFDFGKPEEARLACPRCGALLTDAQRYEMAHGQGFDNWRPRREFAGRRGFQGNAMLWPHPVDLEKFPGGWLQCVAQQQIDAEQSANPRRSLRVIVNTVDAEPFDPTDETEKPPDYQPLMDRREPYAGDIIMIPSRGIVVTGGGDVHPNRIEWSWIAWGRREECWILDHVVIDGDTHKNEVWEKFRRELQREFDHESGAKLSLSFGLLDSAYGADDVLRFLATVPAAGKLRACRGASTFPHPLIDHRWRTLSGNLKGHWVGGDVAKDILYGRLRLVPSEELPAGWMHFGQRLQEQYFGQLTAENLIIEIVGSVEQRRYRNPLGKRNETMDCWVYGFAAFRRKLWNFAAIEAEIAEDAARRKAVNAPAPAKPAPRVRRNSFVGGFS